MSDYKVIISHFVSDENRMSKGGKAGDQTGREGLSQDWYSTAWDVVFRLNKVADRERLAMAMKSLVDCDLIGYDQNQRHTLYDELKKVNWDISKLNKAVETDCSAAVSVACNMIGIETSRDMYTGNEVMELTKTKEFIQYRDTDHLKKPDFLQIGDILHKPGHTAIVTDYKFICRRQISFTEGTKAMKGKDVGEIQKVLNNEGFMSVVSNKFGRKTAAALVRYQAKHKLTPDGIFGPKTCKEMGFYWEGTV